MRTTLAAVAAALLACPPAGAVTAAGRASMTAGEDASMCFDVYPGMVAVGTATATGAVTTEPVTVPAIGVPGDPSAQRRFRPPTTLVHDVRLLATTTGYRTVCVGGIGLRAVSGSVTFTLNLHGAADDYVVVAQCTYRADSPPMCV